ncbi:MAG: hypothetical protein ACM3Q1_05875 [Bacteroidales bacterium]
MNWIFKRLSENSTRAALGAAIASWAGVAVKAISPAEAIAATLALVVPAITPEARRD